MPKTYVIDLRHYLDDKRELAQMAAPAPATARFCGAVVAGTTGWPGPEGDLTIVVCRRVAGRAI